MGSGRLVRFDFLHDPPPDFVARFLEMRLAKHLYAPAMVIGTLVLLFAPIWGLETLRLRWARSTEMAARERFDASRAALSALRLQWQQLDELTARDRRLREIRLSGSAIAEALARVGNALPNRTWATSLSADSSGFSFKGRAADLKSASEAFADLIRDRLPRTDPSFRFSRDANDATGALAFEIRSETSP